MGPTQGPLGSLIHPEPPFDLDLHLRPRTPSSAPPGSSLPPAFATHRFLRALPRAVAALQGLLLPVLGAAGHVGGVAALLRRGGRARGDRRGPGGAGALGAGGGGVPWGRLRRCQSPLPSSIQSFLTRYTRGRGFWLGLRAVRRGRKVQGYQWVDGVPLSFR